MDISAAQCCWCGERLTRLGAGRPWVCPTAACNARQREWGVVREERVGKRVGVRALFLPVPKQVEFFEATLRAPRVLFGGAAGPGKSHALRWGLYRDCLRIPNLNCLLLRRTFAELDNTHLREMERDQHEIGASYLRGEKALRFGNGSVIKAGHCETSMDAANYLSTEWDRVLFDELVTFERDQALEIMGRARTANPAVLDAGGAQVWGGTNPGGRGALWVKSFFVDRVVDEEEFPAYDARLYAYVEARLDDNPYIDPAYRQALDQLPRLRRRQLLEGDWTAFEGQFFDWEASRDGRPWHVRPSVMVAA